MAKKAKKLSKTEQLESYFNRDSEHDNACYFIAYTAAKESKLFTDLEIPLIIFDKAIALFLANHDKPIQAVELYMNLLDEYNLNIHQKIFTSEQLTKYIAKTEFPNPEDVDDEAISLYIINNLVGTEIRLLQDTLEVNKTELENKQVIKSDLGTYTNSQLVLVFYYFFKQNGLTPRESIDIAPIAKFLHIITGKEYKSINSSDFYKKLKTAPNFKTDKSLIKDLETIRPLFQKVQLNEIVKMIDNEIEMSRSEIKLQRKNNSD